MPPQASNTDSPYDFILKDPQQSQRSFMPNLPKPVKILGAIVLVLILVVILGSIFSGGSGNNSEQLISVMARAQEIARVSDIVQQQSKDEVTQGLAATTQLAMTSEVAQLNNFLKKAKVKVTPIQLAAKMDKTMDEKLQTASQSGNLEEVYANYLKEKLADYGSFIQQAFKGATVTPRAILNEAYESTGILLSSQQVSQS